jgi:hypothetical protein
MVGLLACSKTQKDNSKVIASIGGEKITEKYFNNTVRTYIGDQEKANDLLTKPEMRERRNQILVNLVNQKALFQFVKLKGLDKDPQAQLQVASATADAYFQVLSDRLVSKTEPTDSQLKAFYDDYVTQAKAANQSVGIPPFDQIKVQLPMVWKHKQIQAAREALLTQINQQYPVVFDPEYQINQTQP